MDMSVENLTKNTIRWYDEDDGWIDYINIDGVIYGSAHAVNNKYSRSLLRSLLKGIKHYGTIVTELRYNYLVKFYSRHFKVTHIDKNFYKVEVV